MEQTREFQITIEVYRDTNKATYRDTETFESYEQAILWLDDRANEAGEQRNWELFRIANTEEARP